jgi:hypothetical protein
LRWGLAIPTLGWPQTISLLISSASQVTGITDVCLYSSLSLSLSLSVLNGQGTDSVLLC